MTLPVKPENIPDELKVLPQWVNWRAKKLENDRISKRPVNPKTGKPASITDSTTWGLFDDSTARYDSSNATGVGFVFTETDPYVGIDIDHCIDDKGNVALEALEIVNLLSSYTEITQSGTGLHIIVKGKLPPGRRRNEIVEMYDSSRFFVVTGEILQKQTGVNNNEALFSIASRQEELMQAYNRCFDTTEDKGPSEIVKPERSCEATNSKSDPETQVVLPPLPDHEVLSRILCDPRMAKLWAGDHSGHKSRSESDMALTGCFAFHCRKDAGQMDRLFRSSGLMRPKWDTRHSSSGMTYGWMTINKAIRNCKAVYDPEYHIVGDKDNDQDVIIDEINKNFAVVTRGSEVCIMREFTDPITGQQDVCFMAVKDFLLLHRNKKISITISGKNKQIGAGEYWLDSPKRREYSGVIFEPDKPNIAGYYNLYKGFGCEPRPGDWSLMNKHLFEIICNGDAKAYKYLLDWMTYKVQKPGGEKHGVVVVLRGKPGSGKGKWAVNYGRLFGDHFVHLIDSNLITGRFNGPLKRALQVVVDESFFCGDKKAAGKLRGMTTERKFVIEEKFRDALMVTNHCQFVFISNETWVVPAQAGERRYFVLDVSDKRIGDTAYFRALQEQMDNGGREAMLLDLLHRDLSGVDLRKFPKKDALFDQILRGLSPIQSFWYESLRNGFFGTVSRHDTESTGTWPAEIETRRLYQYFLSHNEDIKNLSRSEVFGRDLRKIAPGLRRTQRGNGVRYYTLPSLDVCRTSFEDFIGMKIDWEGEPDND